jgi:tetraacyldisaccharide 4'-kinase
MPDTRRLAAWLERVWYGGEGGSCLRPLSVLYRVVVAVRAAAYRCGLFRQERVDIPVVVVGNLTVGGTGKTPLTAWLVGQLKAQGHRPGVATRGHGRQGQGVLRVDADHAAADVGDEPLLLARRTGVPVCVASRRIEAARALQAEGCDVVVCDDGLQHLALARDLEIAVIDGSRGLGNGRLLPAGPLRESPSRLRHVDFVVVNGGGAAAATAWPEALRMALSGDGALSLSEGAIRPLSAFAGARVHAVAGIGNPSRFFDQLRAGGLDLVEHPFPDHHAFSAADFVFGDDLPVLMTEKDAVKCQAFADHRLWYVPVEAGFAASDAARLSASLESLFEQGERNR